MTDTKIEFRKQTAEESFAPNNGAEGKIACAILEIGLPIAHASSTRLEEIKPTWYTIAAYKLI